MLYQLSYTRPISRFRNLRNLQIPQSALVQGVGFEPT